MRSRERKRDPRLRKTLALLPPLLQRLRRQQIPLIKQHLQAVFLMTKNAINSPHTQVVSRPASNPKPFSNSNATLSSQSRIRRLPTLPTAVFLASKTEKTLILMIEGLNMPMQVTSVFKNRYTRRKEWIPMFWSTPPRTGSTPYIKYRGPSIFREIIINNPSLRPPSPKTSLQTQTTLSFQE